VSRSARRVAYRWRHLHEDADIGADLMKIVFNQGDDARNPGVIATALVTTLAIRLPHG